MHDVAVIIASYNAEATIARAVRAALGEAEAREVVVVDDASQDATSAAAQACDDGSGRLKVLRAAVNRGPAAARNMAIAASRSAWITVLDADDFYRQGRLARLFGAAAVLHGSEPGPAADFIADDLYQVDEGYEAGPARILWHGGLEAPWARLSLKDFVAANIPDPNRPRRELGFLKPLMRRAFLTQHGLTYDETIRLGEDYDLYARALAAGADFRFGPAAGYVSVVRQGSLSGRHGAGELARLRAVDDALLARAGLDAGTRAVIRRHRRSTDKKLQWALLIDAVKAHRPGAAIATLARHPAVSAYVLQRLVGELAGRLRARRTVPGGGPGPAG
jgi:succinoglycan biosynthesis protein ExoU